MVGCAHGVRMVLIVDKFKGWRTDELQLVATLLAGREMLPGNVDYSILYNQVIREIRNRRIKEELFQMKLN
jgi:hypothetical protein